MVIAMTTLDTSGVVKFEGGTLGVLSWEGLGQIGGPFAQGYVEALFASIGCLLPWERHDGHSEPQYVGFSDLAPEALAMILRDCEAFCSAFGRDARIAPQGKAFWMQRQDGGWSNQTPSFPPLRVYLNDAGKVMLELAK